MRFNLVIAEHDFLNANLKEISLFEIFNLNSQSKKFLRFDSKKVKTLRVKTSEEPTPMHIFRNFVAKFTDSNMGPIRLVLAFLENKISFTSEDWSFFFGKTPNNGRLGQKLSATECVRLSVGVRGQGDDQPKRPLQFG